MQFFAASRPFGSARRTADSSSMDGCKWYEICQECLSLMEVSALFTKDACDSYKQLKAQTHLKTTSLS